VPVEPALAVAFSGRGFRATLAALGVLCLLADAGLLARVRYSSSVSGGSVAHGLFARHYPELEQEQFSPEALDGLVIVPTIERISRHSLVWTLVANIWRTSTADDCIVAMVVIAAPASPKPAPHASEDTRESISVRQQPQRADSLRDSSRGGRRGVRPPRRRGRHAERSPKFARSASAKVAARRPRRHEFNRVASRLPVSTRANPSC
jgi:hypothetical protein